MRSGGVRMVRPATALAAIACAVAISGCGGDGAVSAGSSGQAGAGEALSWALEARPHEVDPLRADTRGEQLVTRQVHEPLVASLSGPFGDTRRLPGLALTARGSAGDTIWRLRLRAGVRFQDGSRFNAAAAIANGQRWLTTAEGQRLMPDLFAVDSPRPNLVRFFLERPDPDFSGLLASPQAGIVSPRALFPTSGQGAILRRDSRSGTGPFELRERDRTAVLVAHNLKWWGTERDLGPAFDQVEFRILPAEAERLALLRAGDVQLAEGLGRPAAREARGDPLLDVLPGASGALGLERSVRGVASGREIPSLSGVWLTRIGSS